MRKRTSTGVQCGLLSALAATLILFGASSPALATGVSDTDLRGYKGGLVEIGLKDGTTARGLLYGYTETHLELEIAQERSVRLHRSWVASLKAAPPGSQKSPLGGFPRNAAAVYRAELARPQELPPETPSSTPSASPSATPTTAPAAATPTPEATGSVMDKGLVFQLRLGGNLLAVVGGGVASWLNGSFMFGLKLSRLTLGLGLEMTYSDDSHPNAYPDPTKTVSALVLFQPTLEYTLAMKGALALYLTTGLHLGFMNTQLDPGKDVTEPVIGFHLGLGMRYFFRPRFAIGVEGGLRGVWLMLENDESTNQDDNNTGVMSIYGAATLTAIW